MRAQFRTIWEERGQIATCPDLAGWRLWNEMFCSLPAPCNHDERVTADEVAIALLEGYRHQHGAFLAQWEERRKARRRFEKRRREFIQGFIRYHGLEDASGDLSLPGPVEDNDEWVIPVSGWELLDSWP